MSLSTRYQIPDTNTRSHKFAPFYLSSEPLPLSLLPPLSLQWYGAESDILLKSTCSLDDLQALKEEIKPIHRYMSYRSSYSLLKVWKRCLDFALANPASSCSQIPLTFPKSPTVFWSNPESRIPGNSGYWISCLQPLLDKSLTTTQSRKGAT